jgi:hypothetical protein
MASPNETSYCQVHVPGTEITVRLRSSLLMRLAAEVEDVLAATGRESGGILLGSVSGNALVVEDYDPVPSRHSSDSRFYLHSDVDRGQMASAVSLWSPNGENRLRVIGFYRCNDRPALVARDEERRLFAQELNGAPSVLLLVQPGANGRTALACYVAEQGQTGGREGRLEIDLKKPQAAVVEAPGPATGPHRDAKPQITLTRAGKPSSGLARLAGISFAGVLLWLGFLQYQIIQGMNAEASSAQRTPGIGLAVQPQGTYWRLSWNPSSQLLAGAARGHLRIEDGATRKEVDLDAAELRTASIIYDPSGSEISLHLELFGAEGGRSAAESLHVFAKLPPVTSAQTATRSQAEPAHEWNAAELAREVGQPDSPSLTTQPLR